MLRKLRKDSHWEFKSILEQSELKATLECLQRGSGEMTPQLKLLAALTKDQGLVPNTHMAAYNHL